MGNSGSKAKNRPKAVLDRQIGGVQYRVKFELVPFGNGACKLAFRGVYKGKGPLNGKCCVTKVFKAEAQRHYPNYQPDVEASKKASELAETFNADTGCSKPLRFIVPELATVTRVPDGAEYVKVGDKILIEDFIDGNYEKFNSNGGWESDEVAAIPAFSHYTYCKTDGQLLVCDIQGVRREDCYMLTDPAVLSRQQGQFGPTDMGPMGMAEFFHSHKCTSVCRIFPMPDFNSGRRVNRGRRDRRHSTYTFMLNAEEQEANECFKGRRDLPAIMEG